MTQPELFERCKNAPLEDAQRGINTQMKAPLEDV